VWVLIPLVLSACLATRGKIEAAAHDGRSMAISLDGHSVEIRIGDPLSTARAAFGPADVEGDWYLEWFDLALGVDAGYLLDPAWEGRISHISISRGFGLAHYDVSAVTDRGINLGDTRAQVHAVYGEPDDGSPTDDHYQRVGLRFQYGDEDGRVFHLTVTRPRCPSGETLCQVEGEPRCVAGGADCSTAIECDGSLRACGAGGRSFCGVHQGFACCTATHPVFCDVEGPDGACWTEGTDCGTVVHCRFQWRACEAGYIPSCGEVRGFACCGGDHTVFCDIDGPDGECWSSGTDCSTVVECAGEWVACHPGYSYDCTAKECRPAT
jgi:hypothetical protein